MFGKENSFDYLMSIQKELHNIPEYNKNIDIFISSGQYLEINPKGVNKGVLQLNGYEIIYILIKINVWLLETVIMMLI